MHRIRLRYRAAPGEGGRRACHAQGEQRRTQRRDAERRRGRAQRFEHRVARLGLRDSRPGRGDRVSSGQLCHVDIGDTNRSKVEVERQPIEQRGGCALLGVHAFVERDHAEARRLSELDAVAREHHFARVERGGEAGCGRGREPLRHREYHHAAVGLDEDAALGHRAPRAQRRRQIESAEEPVVGNVQRDATHRG